ncbi:TPA: putative phage abortive infection protein [Serratia marcescens]
MMRVLAIVFITVAINLCIVYYWASYDLNWPFSGWSREELGQFGDSWGVLTSIFSVFAFCGVAYSIILQRQSLSQVTQDACENRDFLKLQRFESVFFQMLGLLQGIIEDIDISFKTPNREPKKGRDAFHYLYGKLKGNDGFGQRVYSQHNRPDLHDFTEIRKDVIRHYDAFYNVRQQNLAHYYRMIYHIYKFIDEASLDDKVKCDYANILRAQISNYELLILFYNCLGEHGRNMECYAIKYKLFDNMPIKELAGSGHKYLIDFKAFGSQKIYHPD